MILALVAVVVAMACNDFLATVQTVAEARGRATLAGLCDAASDLARVAYLAVGVDTILHGINGRAVAILGAMMATSFVTTRATTVWARRLKESHGTV